MQEPKYMAQGDWVTYDTKELGRVRTFRAPSKEMASYLAHKLTTFDQLLDALTYLLEDHKRMFPEAHPNSTISWSECEEVKAAQTAIKKAKEGQ